MSSKYHGYWISKAPELCDVIEAAAAGRTAELDVADIRPLGDRTSWNGVARVQGSRVLKTSMAHATSLARAVTELGLCQLHDNLVFHFSISSRCQLRVSAHDTESPVQGRGSTKNVPHSPSHPTAKGASFVDSGASLDPTEACEIAHRLIAGLPKFASPESIPFKDGLYLFYEAGEECPHVAGGRVVRVGNHPRSEGRLLQRIREHYRSSIGAKNGSVFRRYLGGALIRSKNPGSPCLAPAPGKGHWERQDAPTCGNCSPFESRVTHYLKERCQFSCIRIPHQTERNCFEALLIATFAACQLCQPSSGWLGRRAYSAVVSSSGLWNSDHVGGRTLSRKDVERLASLIEATPRTYGGRNLADTLLLIPCSGGKEGAPDPGLPVRTVADFLSAEQVRILEEGRLRAFANAKTHQFPAATSVGVVYWATVFNSWIKREAGQCAWRRSALSDHLWGVWPCSARRAHPLL